MLVVVVAAVAVAAGCTYTTPELAPVIPVDAESSTVLAADGTVLFAFHGVENRTSVALSEVPDPVRRAVLAVEDARFYDHAGVDLRAVARALRENVEEGGAVQGGSTITQQYVKNALLEADKTLDRKVREAAIAFQLERNLTKDEIFELYLNTVYFGAGAYGVQAAAREFLDKDVADLDAADGALLAGLIRAPSRYDPFQDPGAAVERRDVVIDRLERLGWVTEAEGAELRRADLGLRDPTGDERYPAAHFVEEVRRFLLDDPRFGETRQERTDLLFRGGLRIETTLDPRRQAAAEQALERVLADPDGDPDSALVALDPTSGHVQALVGGRDFFGPDETAKLNLATQGRRPTGSAFKPVVLAAALEEGIGLDAVYTAPARLDLPLADGVWEVENYGGSDGGAVTLLDATTFSYNTAYAQLVLDVGPADAVRMGARLGIGSPLLAVPSAVLGTNDVSPLDLTAAYATLAAGGLRRDPVFVTRVEDRFGTVLYQWEDEPERVVDETVAAGVTLALQQVLGSGTGINARIGRPAAGKTGTGEEWADAWFVGYTPDLVAGVWMGFAEGQIPMVPPTTRQTVTGGSWPAQAWQLFMTDALADAPVSDFAGPAAPAVAAAPDPAEARAEQSAVTAAPDPVEAQAGRPVGGLVPDVVGMPAEPAVDLLERQGLVAAVVEAPDDQFPAGIVAGQEPAPGQPRPVDGRVTLTVADGTAVTRTPDVLGLVGGAVVEDLRRVGVDVEVTVAAEEDAGAAEANRARVWKQSPAPGSPLGDDVVTLWVNP